MYLSLDISNQTLHAVEGSWNGKILDITKAYSYTPDEPCMADGRVTSRDRMIQAIQSLHSLMATKTKKTIITINGSFIMTRDLDLPAIDKKKLPSMVKYEMNGSSGIVRDLLTEYIELGEYLGEDGQKMVKVRASGVPRDVAFSWHGVLSAANLNPTIMDIHSNAMRKVLDTGEINDLSLEGRVTLLADLGENSTSLYVADGKTIMVSRMLPVGHQELRMAAASLANDMHRSPYEHADFSSEIMNGTGPGPNNVLEFSQNDLQSLNEAIQRTIQFAATKLDNRRADTMIIYNTGSLYPHIDNKLAEISGLKVMRLQKIGQLKNTANIDIAPYVNAIGALIRTK